MTNSLDDTLRDRATRNVLSIPDSVDPPSGSRRIHSTTTFYCGEQIPGTQWIVVRMLGQGGVGEVYEVEHASLARRAAFKVLHQDNLFRQGLAERMSHEGRFLAAIDHPNVVDVFDMGILPGGRPYLVLELLQGRDLRAETKRVGVLSIPAALDIVVQALRGLSVLHEAGIVHRDIKLENLFLCADGHIEIIDLGAAERMGEVCAERAPSLGTPRTMAPEQYEGKVVDGRADLYALGIALYELIAGRGPFDEIHGLEALRFAHCERMPPPPSRFAPQFVPPEVDELVLRALAKSPNARFASADVMAAAIAALRNDPPSSDSDVAPVESTIRSICPSLSHQIARRDGTLTKVYASPAWAFAIVIWLLTIVSVGLGVVMAQTLPSRRIVGEAQLVPEAKEQMHKVDPK